MYILNPKRSDEKYNKLNFFFQRSSSTYWVLWMEFHEYVQIHDFFHNPCQFFFFLKFFFLFCWLFTSFEVSFSEKYFLVSKFSQFRTAVTDWARILKKKNAFSVYKSCTIFFWLKVYLPFLKEHLALYLEGMKSLLDWNLIVTRVHRMIYWYLFNKIIVSYVKSIENYKSLGLCGALTTMPLSHILFS